jgi:hypothetical protein
MPPVSFCNGVFLEHAPKLPAFQQQAWQATLVLDGTTLAGPTGRAFSGQGSLGFHRVDPHQDDRSPWWIYPNLTGSSTPCR